MLKRVMLAVVITGAFSAAEFSILETAEARPGWRWMFVGHAYGSPSAEYGGYVQYGSAYRVYHSSRNHGRYYQRRHHHYY